MVKHTPTHTNNFTPAQQDCHILKAVTSAAAEIHIQSSVLRSAGLSPLIPNHLRGMSCFLSRMFSATLSALFLPLSAESHLTSTMYLIQAFTPH